MLTDLLDTVLTEITNDLQMFIASVFILLPTVFFLLRKPWGLPPGPMWKTPLLGNILTFAAGEDMRATLRRLRRQYGEVYSLYLGRRLVFVVNGIDALTEVFENAPDEDMVIRPAVVSERMASQGHGLVHTSSQRWMDDHKLCVNALKSGGDRLEPILKREMSALVRTFKGRGRDPFDPYLPILASTCNVMCSLTLGTDFEHDDPVLRRVVELTARARDLGVDTMLTYFLPIVRYLPGCFCRRDELVTVNAELDDILGKHLLHSDQSASSILLQGMSSEGERKVSAKRLKTIARDLLYSGAVVTAATVTNVLSNLVQHPALQDRMYQEIKDVIGNPKRNTPQDYNALVFTKSFIMETMRTSNATLVGFPGVVNAGVTLRGHVVPEETVILPDIDSAMMDPSVWTDPEQFDPDRFITGEHLNKHDSFIPFFLGYRKCPGEQLAMTETLRLVAAIVQRFKLLPSVEPEVKGKQDGDTSFGARRDFLMSIEERM